MSTPTPDDDATAVRPAVVPAGTHGTDGLPVEAGVEPRPDRPRRRPGRVLLVAVAGLVALVAVLYLVSALTTRDQLPRDAAVAGVPVGGLSSTAARQRLADELGPRAAAPLAVRAGSATAELDPVAAGLTLDLDASVAAAGGGRSFDPRHLWRVLSGGTGVDAVVAVDEPALTAATRDLAGQLDQEPVDATLGFRGTQPRVTGAEDGVRVQQDEAADAIAAGFLGDAPIALPVETTPPLVTTAEAERVRDDHAEPAVAGPVRVRAGRTGSFAVTPAMIASALRYRESDGNLVPALDAERLRKAARPAVAAVEVSKPRDATVRIKDGRPVVVPAVAGTAVGADELAKAVEPVLGKRGDDRTATVELASDEAAFSTADAEKLGIREVTGQFTTYFPYAEYRNVNIGRAAELINGTVLKPGETFSLNEVVGERTRANGFTEGFIISGGKFKRELGGGVSQSATTTYNAMFFAGLKDVEHQPHTLYIDRYPPGREATVAWPDLDLKFQNDTRYGVLVQASSVRATGSSRGSITVRMWSTKTWDKVTSTTPAKSDFTTGRDITDDSPSCEPQAPAQGFDVAYSRLFYRDGAVAKRQDFSWRYGPTDRISCG